MNYIMKFILHFMNVHNLFIYVCGVEWCGVWCGVVWCGVCVCVWNTLLEI